MSQDLLSFLDDVPGENVSAVRSTPATASGDGHNPWADEASSAWQTPSNTQPQSTVDDDDDFGDFEDASAPTITTTTELKSSPANPWNDDHRTSKSNAPKKQASPPPKSIPQAKAKDEAVGQHPFAGRMDFLFDTGDDEYDAGADELGDLATNPEAAMAYSKRIIAEQEAAAAAANPWGSESHANVIQSSRGSTAKDEPEPVKRAKTVPRDPNVLFDADDVSDDDDDFGGFESGNESDRVDSIKPQQKASSVPQSMPVIDLLGLDDDLPATSTNAATGETITSFHSTLQIHKDDKRPDLESRQYSEPENDAWDDFETATPADTPSVSTTPAPTLPIFQSQPSKPTNSKPQPETSLPPTNIPPPSVLISLFPSIIAEADDALFNAIGRLDLKQRQMLLGHPASHQFLKGYLAHATVMARIIAGRKLRWKRDQHLTQSMRIGPAAAGGKGGMKLAGLDKAESAKEDREVVDALRLWRNQVGKLRTAVTAASATPLVGSKLPSVPELAEQMPIKTLKPAEGGITAPHACALCGLKREERVGKVDVEVEDSFGEWWVQGMNMHLSCRDFWTEFEKKLKSR